VRRWLFWEEYRKTGSDPRTGAETEAVRRRLRVVDELPLKDDYRALVTAAITGPVCSPYRQASPSR
jgi:hypothetical protein